MLGSVIENTEVNQVTITKLACSVAEVAEITSLSKPFIRLEIKRGKLKARTFGRRILILQTDLRDYLNQGEITK